MKKDGAFSRIKTERISNPDNTFWRVTIVVPPSSVAYPRKHERLYWNEMVIRAKCAERPRAILTPITPDEPFALPLAIS